ncbi:uncharacterized protein RAG0_09740 [Rhynchosporium agropyri]|uniref:Uncharacterized protein n=1 Tax=Rhynchosporium agropyri TaxID=914238 RepID=A0A1E1KWW5_9HELO|nr:uncharacterized protein RAG0_09740 [Rhynchosporium agropyri]
MASVDMQTSSPHAVSITFFTAAAALPRVLSALDLDISTTFTRSATAPATKRAIPGPGLPIGAFAFIHEGCKNLARQEEHGCYHLFQHHGQRATGNVG